MSKDYILIYKSNHRNNYQQKAIKKNKDGRLQSNVNLFVLYVKIPLL